MEGWRSHTTRAFWLFGLRKGHSYCDEIMLRAIHGVPLRCVVLAVYNYRLSMHAAILPHQFQTSPTGQPTGLILLSRHSCLGSFPLQLIYQRLFPPAAPAGRDRPSISTLMRSHLRCTRRTVTFTLRSTVSLMSCSGHQSEVIGLNTAFWINLREILTKKMLNS